MKNDYANLCGHCGAVHMGTCPRIKAIEYFECGTVRRIEYHAPAPLTPAPTAPDWVASAAIPSFVPNPESV